MSLVNTEILRSVQIFLRVPPLFVIDEIIRFDAKLAEDIKFENLGNLTGTNFFDLDPRTYKLVIFCGIRLILSALGCLLAMCMFALNSKQLTLLFLHLVSVATVLISYWGNVTTIKMLIFNNPQQDKAFNDHSLQDMFKSIKFKDILSSEDLRYQVLANLSLQIVIAFFFIQANLGFRHSSFKKIVPLFLIPTISTILPIPPNVLRHTPLFAAFLSLISTKFPSWHFIKTTFQSLKSSYFRAKLFISRFGIPALLEYQWSILNIPKVLKTFYILRTMELVVKFFAKGLWDIEDGQYPEFRLVKYLLENGSDTCIAILGLTAVLSSLSDRLGKFLKNVLQSDEENDFGTATAIVFYTMVLQNDLTNCAPKRRFVLLYQTLILLLGIVFHFIHNVSNPVLISLGVSRSNHYKKHAIALGIMCVLAGLSGAILYFLAKTHSMSPFLFAAIVFYAAVFEKVCISLVKYGLYLYDARRTTFWGKLDDYIFYATFFGNVTEICLHILLLLNGLYSIFSKKPNFIRSIVLGVHSYFNIWCYGKADYLMYVKRRNALKKIENLSRPTYYQLFKYNDLCAICYQEMKVKTSKVTKCSHIFHGTCLRKWLNVRDRCPLCHEVPIFES